MIFLDFLGSGIQIEGEQNTVSIVLLLFSRCAICWCRSRR